MLVTVLCNLAALEYLSSSSGTFLLPPLTDHKSGSAPATDIAPIMAI